MVSIESVIAAKATDANPFAKPINSSLRATKSVSQLSDIIIALFLSSLILVTTIP